MLMTNDIITLKALSTKVPTIITLKALLHFAKSPTIIDKARLHDGAAPMVPFEKTFRT